MNKKSRKNFRIRLGILLILLSGVFFGISFIIPFFVSELRSKVVAVSTSLILMEIVFWSGGLLVGKELFTKYKSYLNPRKWIKKKKQNEEQDNIV